MRPAAQIRRSAAPDASSILSNPLSGLLELCRSMCSALLSYTPSRNPFNPVHAIHSFSLMVLYAQLGKSLGRGNPEGVVEVGTTFSSSYQKRDGLLLTGERPGG